MILSLVIIAIADGIIVARRLVTIKPKRMTLWSLIAGIIYGIIALMTIESGASLIGGSVIMFLPVVLWLLRVILFGTRVSE